MLKPCWFERPQLPLSLLREKKKRMRKETDLVHWYEADMEKSEGEEPSNVKDVKEK